MQSSKTRHISMLKFLDVLVFEFFQAKTRSSIYTKKSDKTYWLKVSDYKKEKILDISNRNRMGSIFSDETLYAKKYEEFFPEREMPLFLENDKDYSLYFNLMAEVVVNHDNTVHAGIIESYTDDSKFLNVRIIDNNKLVCKELRLVKRIL